MSVLIFADHPIQYQVPIFRQLEEWLPGQVEVIYKDISLGNGAVDPEFGVAIRWDTPILEGYRHTHLSPFWKKGGAQSPASRFVLKAIKDRRPSAIVLLVGYNDPWAIEVLAAAKLLGVPVLWRFEGNDYVRPHGPLKARARSLVLRILYQNVAGFLSIGAACTEHLKSHGVADDRIFSSPYNVEDELFESMRDRLWPTRAAIREQLGIRPDDFVLVVVGKLIERKNPLVVLRALSLCQSRAKVRILFVGSGNMESEIRAAARPLGENKVMLAGFTNQTDLPRYYVAADAALLPSRYETWGLVVNEAQHFGLPVITSSRVWSHLDLIKEGVTGFTFKEGDHVSLAQKIDALAGDPPNAARMGDAAHRHIQGYTTRKAAQGIIDALRVVAPSMAGTLPSAPSMGASYS